MGDKVMGVEVSDDVLDESLVDEESLRLSTLMNTFVLLLLLKDAEE